MAAKLIPMAISYDFDGTLSPGNMQEYDFIPKLGMTPQAFWAEAKKVAKEQQGDEILAYMHLMLKKAREKEVLVTRNDFEEFGKKVELFPGVEDWFDRINAYGRSCGVAVKHYIISSGIREMILGTKIKRKFSHVYASAFMYDYTGAACAPIMAVNYTAKTQYIFRINKGSFDVSDNSTINQYVRQSERDTPFANMVFIGDGETDIPCMRLVKAQGGHSIAVFNPRKRKAKSKAEQLLEEGRASLIAPADYGLDTPIDKAVKAIIDIVAANSRLVRAGK